ncbi:t complex protein 1 subunit gamma [Echinococcus multilocularis]|uniref:T-complex protein 1 subunit gamma n=1 Tax=Echinococcus multilocularis TaxID=6211 RepID=A0A068YCU0_ECHMU|nr:t complex protein 1 subunit gamma [Echinococcus multilocularis]
MRGTPVLILNQNTRREHGKDVQFGNIEAGKTVADVIRTCLGPRAMLKMLLDPMGSIVMTNDGNAILREITVEHPAAKSMIEIARTQDEEVGDGTTSVIVLAGEVLSVAAPCLEKQIHPTKIITAFRQALEDITTAIDAKLSIPVDVNSHDAMVNLVKSCVGTKIINKWVDLSCNLAISSVKVVTVVDGGRKEIDIKRYAKVEKIPGGSIEDSCVLDGVMFNKDILHPKMRRRIESPRILLLDCSLEYKKGESQTTMEICGEKDFTRALEIEEEYVGKICEEIIRHKPDVVITEKGVSDLAQHFLVKAGISVIRRLRKTDCLRIGRCSGATIVSRTDEIKEEDIGTGAGLFEVKLIGDEYFTFITGCKDPKACTILLRGASKDVLNEIERNLQDAMSVVRSAFMDPRLVPGGGALEMALAQELSQKAKSAISGVQKVAYLAVAQALEVIPRTLAQNCGANVLKQITELRAYHAIDPAKNWTMGINGETGQLVDMKELGVWDPVAVKSQTFKTAIETAILLLRIDDIVSGTKKAADTDSKP